MRQFFSNKNEADSPAIASVQARLISGLCAPGPQINTLDRLGLAFWTVLLSKSTVPTMLAGQPHRVQMAQPLYCVQSPLLCPSEGEGKAAWIPTLLTNRNLPTRAAIATSPSPK